MFRHLSARTLSGRFLSGTDVRDNSELVIEDVSDGVYYLMESTCTICAENYSFLNSLQGETILEVVGIAPADAKAQLRAHVINQELSFPVLVEMEGSLMDVMPLHGTPLTLVISSGRLQYLIAGALTAEHRHLILGVAGVATGKPQASKTPETRGW